jgi:hypothetical protein
MKKTLGVFLIPGSYLSLDENSCVSWYNYGRKLIFFNPSKKFGKLHFWCYLICDASTFACITIKVPTRNDSDPADPEETLKNIQQGANYSMLNKLILEMCRKYNNTFCTVTMDNYYTFPAVLILLHRYGIYARGTVKKNHGVVPSQIVLTRVDCNNEHAGFVWMDGWMDVCEFANMQDFGWNDNNPVHVLSTADSL